MRIIAILLLENMSFEIWGMIKDDFGVVYLALSLGNQMAFGTQMGCHLSDEGFTEFLLLGFQFFGGPLEVHLSFQWN